MIFNVSSGGAALNYSVRASDTVPSGTGKVNEIVIVAQIAVGDVQINCIAEPTTRSDGTSIQNGDVCILANTNTGTPFNVLKKSALYGLVGQCKQLVGGVWINLGAYIYQSGSWTQFSMAIPETLEECSWEEIALVGSAGIAGTSWSVGDEKTITLSTSEVITLQIIGFGHDDLSASGGGKAPITFCFKNCMNTKRIMNPAGNNPYNNGSNVGGYSGSAIYPTINGGIYNSLPADLRAVMKTVNKLTSAGNMSTSIVTTQEKLFMLSNVEVSGELASSVAGEGSQYAYFTNDASRLKTVSGTASQWWLRSPTRTMNYAFCVVSDTGVCDANQSLASIVGVALALCV